MKSQKINTLIVGGAGVTDAHEIPQLIPHLLTLLLESGRRVTVLSRTSTPTYVLPTGVDYVVEGQTQNEVINRILDTHQEVIHFAYTTVPYPALENPLAELMLNLPATMPIFAAASRTGAKLVLVSSGSALYGEAHTLPISETHLTKPTIMYGVNKLTLENYAISMPQHKG